MIVVLFDTETTDLIKNTALPMEKQPKIIEFYGVKLRQSGDGVDTTFEQISEYESLYAHPAPLKPITTKITGLKNEDLVDAPPIQTELGKIKDFMSDVDRIVAHNLAYDIGVTDIEFKRHEVEAIDWPEKVCTVEATEHIHGYRLSLSALHKELFGEAFDGAHRAKVDVHALLRCYEELVKREEI